MEVCTKRWVRRCLKCQARKTSRQTVSWPVLPIPLPNSPVILVSVDYFGPLPTTAGGNSYILLFMDHFSRWADMLAVTTVEFTAEGTTNSLVNHSIPLWGYPSTPLSDNGLQFCDQLATVVYKLLAVHKLTVSSYHPSENGGVERINHIMTQMLAMVCNEHQTSRMHTFPTSNTLSITPLARLQTLLPIKFMLDTYRAPSSPFSIPHTAVLIRASTVTISRIATLLASTKTTPKKSCVRSTPSQSPV